MLKDILFHNMKHILYLIDTVGFIPFILLIMGIGAALGILLGEVVFRVMAGLNRGGRN